MAGNSDNFQVGYRPFPSGPLTKNRKATDTAFIYLAGVIFTIWLGLSIYAISNASTIKSDKLEGGSVLTDLIRVLKDGVHSTIEYFRTHDISIVVWSTIIGAVVTFAALLLACVIPKFFVIIAYICLVAFCLNYALSIFGSFATGSAPLILASLFINGTRIICIAIMAVCISRVRTQTIAEFIQKSCKAIFTFPSLFLFGFFIFLLDVLVLGFTIFIICINTNIFWISVILLASVYISNFIMYFGSMVISATIATGHWSKNKADIPKTTVLKCIATVSRYHLGSVAYASTIILPIFQAIYVAFKCKFQPAEKTHILIELYSKLYAVFNTAQYSVITISMQGHHFYQATKRTFYLLVKNCTQTIAIISVSYVIAGFIFAIALVSAVLPIVYKVSESAALRDHDGPYLIMTSLILAFLFYMPILLTLITAIDSTLLCSLQEQDDTESEEKPSFDSRNKV